MSNASKLVSIEEFAKGVTIVLGLVTSFVHITGIAGSTTRLFLWAALAITLLLSWRSAVATSKGTKPPIQLSLDDEDYYRKRQQSNDRLWLAAFAGMLVVLIVDLVINVETLITPVARSEVDFNFVTPHGKVVGAKTLKQAQAALKEPELTEISQPFVDIRFPEMSCTGTPRDKRLADYFDAKTASVCNTGNFSPSGKSPTLLYGLQLQENLYFDLKRNDYYDNVEIKDVVIKVSQFVACSSPCGVMGVDAESINKLIVVQMQRQPTPPPWEFHATYLLDDPDGRTAFEWGRKKVRIGGDLTHGIIVDIEAKDAGYYTYTADLVVKADLGKPVPIPLVTEPRTVKYWGERSYVPIHDLAGTGFTPPEVAPTPPPDNPGPVEAPIADGELK